MFTNINLQFQINYMSSAMLSIAKCKSVRQNKIFHFCLPLVQEVPEYDKKNNAYQRTSVINIQEMSFCGIFCHAI